METQTSRRTFHRYRVEVLERAVRLEVATDSVISASFGRSASLAELLRVEVLSGVSVQKRISTLKGVLEHHDLSESYPFVVPILHKLFELRNAMAHSVDDTMADPAEGTIRLLGMRRGRLQPVTFTHTYLDWLRTQALQVQLELDELYWRVVPEDPSWHEA